MSKYLGIARLTESFSGVGSGRVMRGEGHKKVLKKENRKMLEIEKYVPRWSLGSFPVEKGCHSVLESGTLG